MKGPMTCLLLIVLAGACGSDPDPLDVEGCEHLQEGPAAPITATADTTGAPAVDTDHMRYDVALVAVTGGNGGFVTFASAEAVDYVFFLDAPVPMAFSDASDVVQPIEESLDGSDACEEIRGRHTIELGVGTYFIELGPTAEDDVGIVVEEAAHTHE